MIRTLFLFSLCFVSGQLYAQEISVLMRQHNAVVGALEQWQNGVDDIRLQVGILLKQNDTLTIEYNHNKAQERRLLQAIDEQRKKIDALHGFLKTRAGKSDQQLRIDALEQELNLKRLQLNKNLLDYKTQSVRLKQLQKSLEEKRLKVSEYELHQSQNAQIKQEVVVPEDVALNNLRKELEAQIEVERRLEGQANVPAIESNGFSTEIEALQNKLTALQSQKAALLNKPMTSAGVDKDKYYLMQAKKEELGLKIRAFERRIDSLKASSALTGSWVAGRKEMVHKIIQGDASNKKLLNEIKELKENILLLRNQIGVLEKRVLFSNKK